MPGVKRKPAAALEVAYEEAAAEDEPEMAAASTSGSLTEAQCTAAREGWEETYRLILEQRKSIVAECDLYGGMVYVAKENTPETRYHTLVNSILAPQCRDSIVHEAVKNLIDRGCTPEKVLAASEEDLCSCCSKVRMHQNKIKHIIASTKILVEKHTADVPQTYKELIALPGIGPKSAHFILMVCWGKVEGVKVDTHIHRICNRLGWVQTKTEEKTRQELESWLPSEHWGVDGIKKLVGFGQEICTAIKPKCASCAVKGRCPSAAAA
mmetsp:Transcript_34290/g.80152  ORF Transcript_34290/g.80152 Transcript_34290/m.80152 type:complete len:267 (+) Transcript_34290:107-907(+)